MNIMDVILDIESKARAIMKESEEICAEQSESRDEEIETFKQEVKRSAEMKIAGFRAEQNAKIDKKIEELGVLYGEKTDALNKKYNENKSKWVDDIVKRTLM